MFAEGYMPKKRGRKGRALSTRAQTPQSRPHGGATGHFAGAKRGPHAAMPHNGQLAGGGHGMAGSSPVSRKLARSTGYGDNDYAAASPSKGFVLAGRGC